MENDTKEKLVKENDEKLNEEEGKGIEDPTKRQLLNTAKESPAGDEALQTLPTTAPARNKAAEERSQEEIQQEAELVATYTKDVQTPEHEFDMKKDIPEDEMDLSAENKEELEPEVAHTAETTTVKEPHSNEDTAKINPMNHTAEQEVQASDSNEKLVIEYDGKLHHGEASVSKDESVLPIARSVEKEAVDQSSQEEKQQEAELEATCTKEVQTQQNEFYSKNDILEDETELSNTQESQPEAAQQTKETITVKEPHLNEETKETNPIKDTQEQAVTAFDINEKLLIEDDGFPRHESLQTIATTASVKNEIVDEASALNEQTTTSKKTDSKEETAETNPFNANVKQEKVPTSNTNEKLVIQHGVTLDQVEAEQSQEPTKSVQEDESVQNIHTATSAENQEFDESIQEKKQEEAELKVTFKNEVLTQQNENEAEKDIPEEVTELSPETKQESEPEAAAQTEDTTRSKEPYLNEVTTEINPIDDIAKQEVPPSDLNDKLVIEDDDRLDQEKAELIVEVQKKGLPHDESPQTTATTTFIGNEIVDEAPALNEQTTTLKETHSKEETAETKPINETVEQDKLPTSNTNEKPVIEDEVTLDQVEEEQSQEPIKSVQEDESVQNIHTATSAENQEFDEGSQEEEQQEVELEVTFTNEVLTQQNEHEAENEIPEDVTELSAETKQESEPEAAAQTEDNTRLKEPHLNEVTAEMHPTDDIAEKEDPPSDLNDKLVIEDVDRPDQEKAELIVEVQKKGLPHDESPQTTATTTFIENEIVDEAPALNEQTTTLKEMHSKEETAETNPINETVEQDKLPTSNTNEKPVIEDEVTLDQVEEQSQEPIKSVQEDESVQNIHTATSAENQEFDEGSQEEEQQEAELEVTFTNEVLTQQNEHEAENEIPEDMTELSPETKQESEPEAAAQTEDTTRLKEPHLNEVTAEMHPIDDIAEQEDPPSNLNDKLVTEDADRLDQEKVELIVEFQIKGLPQDESPQTTATTTFIGNEIVDEAPALNEQTTTLKETHSKEETAETNPINETVEQQKLLTSNTNEKLVIEDEVTLDQGEEEQSQEPIKSVQEDESVQKIPTATSAENQAVEESSQEQKQHEAELEVTFTNEVLTQQNEHEAENEIPEEVTEISPENEQESEPEAVAQTKETNIVKEPHLNKVTEVKPINDIGEQEVPPSNLNDKLVIVDDERLDQEKAELIVEVQNKSLPHDKSLQTTAPTASIKNEIDDEAPALNELTTTLNETHLKEETTETNPINETVEQEKVSTSNSNEKLVIKDDVKLDQVEAEQSQEPIKSVQEDESVQKIPTTTSAKNQAVDESSQEEKQQEAELEVTFTNEMQMQQNECEAEKDITEDVTELIPETKQESEPEAAAQTKDTTTAKEPYLNEVTAEINPIDDIAEQEVPALDVNDKLVIEDDDRLDQGNAELIVEVQTKSLPEDDFLQTMQTTASIKIAGVDEAPAQNEQTTTLKESHLKEENVETNPINETVEQEKLPTSSTNEKLVIEDDGKFDQVEAELSQEPIKSVPEDESVQKIPTTTSVKNQAVDEGSQEEKQQEADIEVTFTNEVQIQQNEYEAEKDTPEDVRELRAENEQESEPKDAAQTEETTIVKEPHLNEVTAEIIPINDTAEQEVPPSDLNEKLIIEDDGKLDQEKAEQIEELRKSLPEDESLQTIPTAASVENEAPDESSIEIQPDAQLELTNTEELQTPQNKFDTKKDIAEDETLINAENKQETEHDTAAQNEETTTVKEAHSDEETAETNPVNETAEQESGPASQMNENLLIKHDGVQEDESVQTIPTVTSVENEAVDESSQEEKQQEEELEATYTNEVRTQQNEFKAKKDIPEDETELSAKNTQESAQGIAAQTEETSTVKESHSNEETAEINPINDAAEQEVPASGKNGKLVIGDDDILDQEEAAQILEPAKSLPEDESLQKLPTAASIVNDVVDEALSQKEQTTTVRETFSNEETAEQEKLPTSDANDRPVMKGDGKLDQVEAEWIEDPIKSVQEDESVQTITTTTSVENEGVDESSQEEKQKEVQLEVIYTNKDESELCAEENRHESEPEAAAQTEEISIVKEEHSNEENAEINHFDDTAEQEKVPAGNANEKIVIEDDGKSDQGETEQIEEPTKSLPEDESLQTLPTAASIKNEVDEAPSQKDQTTTAKETYSNEKTAETNPINETPEQEKVPTSYINEEVAIEDDSKLDQVEAEVIKETIESVQEDKFIQTTPTVTSVENEAVDENNQEEKQQEAQLEVTYTNKVQTQQNEFDPKKNISEDEMGLSTENKQEPEPEAAAQTEETTPVKEVHSNEETAEINHINDTAEQEVQAGNTNETLVIKDDGKSDQVEAEKIEAQQKSLPEDEPLPTLPTTASIENKIVDDTPAQNEQTTTVKETHSNEENAETNPIDDTAEEVPASNANEKLVIKDDSKLDQEKAEQIEGSTKSVPEDDLVQTLPTATLVENEEVDESSQEEKHQEEELAVTYTKEEMELSAENKQEPECKAAAQTKENTIVKEAHSNEETAEINIINDTAEQEEIPAGNANEKLVIDDEGNNDQEEAEQIEDPTKSFPEDESLQTLITAASVENEAVDEAPAKNEPTVKETHSNEEASETNPIDETAEQEKVPTSGTNEKLVIKDDGKLDQGEAELNEEAIKSVQEDETAQTLLTATSVEREAIDDSSQEKHQEAELEETYTKKVQAQQNEVKAKMHISEDETEFSAENTQESQPEAAAQTEETTTVKEVPSSEETAEVNPINDTGEHEDVPASNVNVKLVIEDDSKLDQEKAEQIEESTKSVPEDDFAQTLPTATLVKNEEADESIHEEKHQEEELAVTYTKEDETELSAKNNQESEPKAAAQSEETTTEKELQPNEEHAEINPINDTTEQEFPASDMNDKLVIKDDAEIDQEKVEQIEEPTKSVLQDESVQALPTTTSVRNKAVDESSEEQHQEAELKVTYTEELQTQQNEIDAKKDILEEKTEIIAEIKEELEPKAAAQTDEPTTVKELQSNEETAEINPINDTAEQEVPTPNVNDKPVIDDDGKLDQEEAKQIEEPTKSLSEDESLQIIPTIESAENEAVDDSSKDKQHNGQLEVTYRKKAYVVQDETELSAENKQESEPEAAAQCEETTKVKELPSYEETAEINPVNDTAEQEVPASDANEKLEIESDGKLDKEEAKQIEEPKKSFPEDESLKTIPATASVENEAVDETSKQIQPDAQLQDAMELSSDDKQKSEPKAAAQNEETTTVKEPHLNEETAEINPINDTAEQVEVPGSDANEKLMIMDDGQLDQEEKQIEEQSKSLPKDEPLQSLATTVSVKNEAVDESSQEEIQLDTQLEVTYTEEVQRPNNEFNTKKDIPEDETELSVEKKQEIEPEVASQSEETTTVKELYSNEETAETKPIMTIHDTAEREVPAFDANKKIVFEDDGKFIQEEAKENEGPTKSLPEDESLQSLLTAAAVENEAVDESSHGEIQPEAQLPVRYTIEVHTPQNELNVKKDILEDGSELSAENKLKSESQVAAQNQETTTIKQPHSEDTAEINHTDDTKKKEEVPPSNAKEKLVIEDQGKLDQDKAKQVQKGTKSVPEDESMQTLATAAPVQNGAVDESSQEEIQQEAELEVTYAKKGQTAQIEFHAKKDILEDESELGAENEQKSASQAATQNETKPAVTNTKEDQGSDNDLAKNVEVLEAFDLHKVPGNSFMENEKKSLIQSEAKSQETAITKHPSLERPETAEISPNNDTKELEKEIEVAKPGNVSESVSTETTEQTGTTTTAKEAISRDFHIKTEQTDTRKLETQETKQFNSTKEDEVGDEFEKISPSSSISVISRDSQDTDMKVSNKKSHGILSGVGSKVKHSISKVKKAITGKSSHQKAASPKENK